MMGTVDYMAPEQALDFHRTDIRADLYSLGCTFYFLLTGQAPFAEGTAANKLLFHQMKDPAPLERSCGDLPPRDTDHRAEADGQIASRPLSDPR